MPLIATRGAASAQGFGEFAQSSVNYIEDVFSTYLYTGNSSTQTITNGIDLSGKGGMVWVKSRSAAYNGWVFDTQRGANKYIVTNSTSDQGNDPTLNWSFLSNGFSQNNNQNSVNLSGTTYTSWTFRKQAKFFDVVTYAGDGTLTKSVPHNLGSVPGCIIVKRTDSTGNWVTVARTESGLYYGPYSTFTFGLNSTQIAGAGATAATREITSTTFNPGKLSGNTSPAWEPNVANTNGATYVAYLFAHNAGGFGASGTDNVISCGSFTSDGSGNATVTLGYEPQWVMMKRTDSAAGWWIVNNMMPFVASPGTTTQYLSANLSDAEASWGAVMAPTSTGFTAGSLGASQGYIYIAIRRGPMRTPTSGTSVFSPVSTSGNVSSITAGFPVDLALGKEVKNATSYGNYAIDRLRGGTVLLVTNTTAAESTSQTFKFDSNTQFLQSGAGLIYGPSIYWLMRRAPGFFDVVCYTGTGADMTIPHNLGVKPEIIILKKRSAAGNDWPAFWAGASTFTSMYLNSTQVTGGNAGVNLGYGGGRALSAAPTATNFYLTNDAAQTTLSATFVAYLFATVAGVSKVGSYAGSGILQTIPCGFASGARFVLIKRTDATGDWWVYDSARGITSGNDPYLFLNSTAAEVTGTNYVDTDSTGFKVTAAAPAGLNAVGGNYIFLAIA